MLKPMSLTVKNTKTLYQDSVGTQTFHKLLIFAVIKTLTKLIKECTGELLTGDLTTNITMAPF